MAKTTQNTTADAQSGEHFTDEERAAMKERAKEARAARKGVSAEEAEAEVLAKIAEFPEFDRELAEWVHNVITKSAPELMPRLWYGMPAYAKNGKLLCFFQPASKFKARYATLGFSDTAALDDGTMWPASYALTTINAADEKRIAELVVRAVG